MHTETGAYSEFAELRRAFLRDPQLSEELEWLLRISVENFNPSSRANRFIIGALVEWGIALAAYSGGVLTLPQGHDMDGDDVAGLRNAAQYRWSVKSSFSRQRNYTFIIQNVRGRRVDPNVPPPKCRMEPTLFLHPLLPGIVHVHPDRHLRVTSHLRFDGDAWVLPLSAVAAHAQEHPDQVVPLRVPPNPGAKQVDPALDIVRAFVIQPHFHRLGKPFRDQAARARDGIIDQLREIKAMESRGELTTTQARAAIDRMLAL